MRSDSEATSVFGQWRPGDRQLGAGYGLLRDHSGRTCHTRLVFGHREGRHLAEYRLRAAAAEGRLNTALPTLGPVVANAPDGSLAHVRGLSSNDRDASNAILRESPLNAFFVVTADA
jgi:hypothetical protein